MIRLRITFSKNEEMRFIGHLDLYRAWERTFRRAQLPLAFTQGFKPHPRINIAAALPLGFTSSNDLMDIWLREDLTCSSVQSRLAQHLPPGLKIQQVELISLNSPTMQSQLRASQYFITFHSPPPNYLSLIKEGLNQPELLVEKKGKIVNIRPLILDYNFDERQKSQTRLVMILSSKPEANLRPDEVIKVIGINPELALFHREKLIFAGELEPDTQAYLSEKG